MKKRVAIVDYGCGNLRSVVNAINSVGGEAAVIDQPDGLADYQLLLLPGVGSFRYAMEQIRNRRFDATLRNLVLDHRIPILGICLGMQLMAMRSSEDGETEGLGLLNCEVDRFGFDRAQYPALKIPHVGFNTVQPRSNSHLFADFGNNADFYFTHSYRMRCIKADAIAATCWHGEEFVAAVELGHIAATQFHPEKSQANGLQLLRNFIERF